MCDSFAANLKKLLVGWRVEQLRIEGDLLHAESLFATLCRKKGKVLFWRLVADDAVGLAANEGQIGYIVGLSWRQHQLSESKLPGCPWESDTDSVGAPCNRQAVAMGLDCHRRHRIHPHLRIHEIEFRRYRDVYWIHPLDLRTLVRLCDRVCVATRPEVQKVVVPWRLPVSMPCWLPDS